MNEGNTMVGVKCDICSKKDEYIMCKDCFNILFKTFSLLKKNIKDNAINLQATLTNSGNTNSKILKSGNEQALHKRKILKLKETGEMLNVRNEAQKSELSRLTTATNVRKENIANLNERLNNLEINNDEKDDAIEDMNTINNIKCDGINIKEHRKHILTTGFKHYLINTNSLIIISEYFDFISDDNGIDILTVTKSGTYSIEKSFGALPIKIKKNVFLNKINCIKANKFLYGMHKFIKTAREKLALHLPHRMDDKYIYSNKTNKQYLCGFYPNLTFISDEKRINEVLVGIKLLNINYVALVNAVFPEEKGKGINGFVSTMFIEETKGVERFSIKNESAFIDLEKEIEVDGFIVLNDYFI